jgi:hypothetical protein
MTCRSSEDQGSWDNWAVTNSPIPRVGDPHGPRRGFARLDRGPRPGLHPFGAMSHRTTRPTRDTTNSHLSHIFLPMPPLVVRRWRAEGLAEARGGDWRPGVGQTYCNCYCNAQELGETSGHFLRLM